MILRKGLDAWLLHLSFKGIPAWYLASEINGIDLQARVCSEKDV